MRFHPMWRSLLFVSGIIFAGPMSIACEEATTSHYQISGVVLDARTHAPLVRCHISAELERQSSDQFRRSALPEQPGVDTDSQGRFVLDLPAGGQWRVSGSAPGFRKQAYDEHGLYSSAVVTGPGINVPALIFRLIPDAAIAGFVLDEAGEPVRNASVVLQEADPKSSDGVGNPNLNRQTANTDDRGHYEVSGIPPGTYLLYVQATPWYASSRFQSSGASSASYSAFDVVYPLTWYPGVTYAEAASKIDLHGGDSRQISFDLVPVPAVHFKVPSPSFNAGGGGRRSPRIERVERGQPAWDAAATQSSSGGQLDFGGLAPGLYRVIQPGVDGRSTSTYMQVQAGEVVSSSAASSLPVSDVILHFAGGDNAAQAQVTFTDLTSGAIFQSDNSARVGLRSRNSPQLQENQHQPSAERTMQIPSGRYRASLSGDSSLYLAGVSSKSGPLSERNITLPAGSVTLTLLVGRRRNALNGKVRSAGKEVEGALVLLIPADWDERGSIRFPRLDQSNTDGSFELLDVIPGQYILVAINGGWDVNWHDPETLRRYLLRGVPLVVGTKERVRQDLVAQSR